jgi:type II secretory pathway predicted ATPase ExeA
MRHFFGFTKEPFASDIKVDDLYHTPALEGMKERFLYAVNLGAMSVVTGDVGSGKSTALRYVSSFLHPSQYHVIPVIATTGSVIEICKQICIALEVSGGPASLWLSLCTLYGERLLRSGKGGRYRYLSLMRQVS